MIKIYIKKESEFKISRITVKGHALIIKNQENQLCSLVSTVMLGTINTINLINKAKKVLILNKNGLVDIHLTKNDKELETVLLNTAVQLQTITLYYKKNIKIFFL